MRWASIWMSASPWALMIMIEQNSPNIPMANSHGERPTPATILAAPVSTVAPTIFVARRSVPPQCWSKR